MYSKEEVYNSTLSYFNGDELATNAWIDKYCLKDKLSNLLELNPDMMHRRIADEFYRIENRFKNPMPWEDIYHVLKDFKFIVPQGRPMAGIGNPHQICSIGNCFAIDSPHDSYAGILKADEEMAQIFKRGGGVGINISTLRPNGSTTSNSVNGIEGATQYMDRYSYTTGEVAQDGRRGALMIAMDISHPDSERFITKKLDKKSVTNANISIWADNKFMECVASNSEYRLSFNGKSYGYKKAKELFRKIAETAHASAEPGLLFKDNITSESPADCYDGFKTIVTNPCVHGSTDVITRRGSVEIRYLIGKTLEIWNGNQWVYVTPFKTSDKEKLTYVSFSNDKGLWCTDNHEFVMFDGSRKKLKDLNIDDRLSDYYMPNGKHMRHIYVVDINKKNTIKDKTYCLTDEKDHTCVFNGTMTGQCGELPLSPYNSCMLLLLNLSSYVIDPFTPDARINEWLLKYHSQIAQRLMDDMIELEIEKIDAIIEKITNDDVDEDLKERELKLWIKIKSKLYAGRRTGTGITGLGDMLAMLNCGYADDNSIQICDKVFKIISTGVYESSIKLARERGAFDAFKHALESTNPYLNRILRLIEEGNPNIWEEYCKYGRRNIACLTIAPAGTVSLMTGTTSGVEPLFMPIYKRRRRIDDESKCVFKDSQGRMFEEYIVVHPKLKTFLKMTKDCTGDSFSYEQWMEVFKSSPYYQYTAQEINPITKVDMQSVIQMYIDHSISNTYNLKKDTTIDEIENLYMYAWEKRLKGITVYRDGSLDGVLNAVDDKSAQSNIFVQHSAPKRPKELKSNLINITSKGIKYAVIIGLLEDKPYEVFAFKIPEGWDVKNCDGIVTKIQKGRYDFTGDGIYLKNIHTDFNEEVERAITLSTSMLLRTGAKIEFVCKTLKKINPTVNSFTSAIARVLSKYIPNGELQGEVCPKCGGKLIREDGCVRCTQCADSKCNFVKLSKNGKNI